MKEIDYALIRIIGITTRTIFYIILYIKWTTSFSVLLFLIEIFLFHIYFQYYYDKIVTVNLRKALKITIMLYLGFYDWLNNALFNSYSVFLKSQNYLIVILLLFSSSNFRCQVLDFYDLSNLSHNINTHIKACVSIHCKLYILIHVYVYWSSYKLCEDELKHCK